MINNALEGFTVLDLSQGIAGPYCATLLADMGARVLKVEPPGGDWLRAAGGRVGGSTAMFETFNRAKESIVLDLKSPSGLAAARQLAGKADIVIENGRVGAIDRLGLGYQELAAERPELIYTSISGFGQKGPNALRPATDTVIQAYSGLAVHATSSPEPSRLRVAIVDVVSGLYASQATLAAVIKRLRTGQGQWVRVDLVHAMAALQAYKIADNLVNGPASDQEAFAVVGNYMTKNGELSISAASDRQVVACLKALDLVDVLHEPEFADAAGRHANQSALRKRVSDVLKGMPLTEALNRLEQADVPCQRVLDYAAFVADVEDTAPEDVFQRLHCADGALMYAVRTPGTTSAEQLTPAPLLNQHATLIRAEFDLQD